MSSIITNILHFIGITNDNNNNNNNDNNDNDYDITIHDIISAKLQISKSCCKTPLIRVGGSYQGLEPSFFIKCENLQHSGAFKLRGAYNMISRLTDEQKNAGIVTFSSGNHGLAISLAARMLGLNNCVVVMPTNAPTIKRDGVIRYGGEVVFVGTTTLERKTHAEMLVKERKLTMIPPYDHNLIIAGQGTIGLEINEDFPRDKKLIVYVPCSGGGLISGVAMAIKTTRRDAIIVGVEPCTAPKMTVSLAAGTPTTLKHVSGIADGLLSVRPGDITFKLIQKYVDRIETVTNTEIAFAVKWLFNNGKIVVEPSGAASVAAVLRAAREEVDASDTIVVAVVSGGNVNSEDYAKYITLKEGDII